MKKLSGARTGQSYRLIWFIGEVANFIRYRLGLEENRFVRIISNLGGGTVIFAYDERRIAVSGDVSSKIVIDSM